MATLLSNNELNTARKKYIISATFLIAGYITLLVTAGWQVTLGIFLVQTGMNFDRSGDKIVSKLQ